MFIPITWCTSLSHITYWRVRGLLSSLRSILITEPTEFKTQDVHWPFTQIMTLTSSVSNLSTLVQYLSVRGCPTWQSTTSTSGNSKTQLCRKLPTVISNCWIELHFVQESLPHAYISSYSSTALQKWPYASNTSHHHTDSYQYTVKTTWRTSKTKRTYTR